MKNEIMITKRPPPRGAPEKKKVMEQVGEDLEKAAEEWWHLDRLDTIGWAAIFIWGALVILAEAAGYKESYSWWSGWSAFFTGAGFIVLLATLYRVNVPEYRKRVPGRFSFGLFLVAMGLIGLINWAWFLPVMLLVVAAAILYKAFVQIS